MYLKANKNEVLQLLTNLAEGISSIFGPNCETLIQDISLDSHPILAIFNNHVSGRQVGSTEDIFGNSKSAPGSHLYLDATYVNKLVVRPDGKKIKSTTFSIKGDDYCFALGINFDYTALSAAENILNNLTSVEDYLSTAMMQTRKTRLEEIFDSCIEILGKPVEKMSKNDRISLMMLLKKENAFNYQKSVPFIADKLNVSRYTIYKDLKDIKELDINF